MKLSAKVGKKEDGGGEGRSLRVVVVGVGGGGKEAQC